MKKTWLGWIAFSLYFLMLASCSIEHDVSKIADAMQKMADKR